MTLQSVDDQKIEEFDTISQDEIDMYLDLESKAFDQNDNVLML